jgi:hypothetical protein
MHFGEFDSELNFKLASELGTHIHMGNKCVGLTFSNVRIREVELTTDRVAGSVYIAF